MLSLILKENSFDFNGKNYLHTYGKAMGTKMAVAFANIFMAKVEKEIMRQRNKKPQVWKRFIHHIFCLSDTYKEYIQLFFGLRKPILFPNNIKKTSKRDLSLGVTLRIWWKRSSRKYFNTSDSKN